MRRQLKFRSLKTRFQSRTIKSSKCIQIWKYGCGRCCCGTWMLTPWERAGEGGEKMYRIIWHQLILIDFNYNWITISNPLCNDILNAVYSCDSILMNRQVSFLLFIVIQIICNCEFGHKLFIHWRIHFLVAYKKVFVYGGSGRHSVRLFRLFKK